MKRAPKAPAESVSLYQAKTHLSQLVERAAGGEEIVIGKNGVPLAKLVAYPSGKLPRKPAHAGKISFIAKDFDAPEEGITALFEGR